MKAVPVSAALALAWAAVAHSVSLPPNDFVVPSGETVVYDTNAGRLIVDNLIVRPAGTLKVVGPNPFAVFASESIVVYGTVDLSGDDAVQVATLNTTNQPEPGAAGQAGGGQGGVGSLLTSQSTPQGGSGFGPSNVVNGGALGGESGFGLAGLDGRRPGGGGGGVLGPDAPETPNLDDPVNIGLVAQDGVSGGVAATGAVSQAGIPAGGAKGASPFSDGDPTNDFWGRRLDPVTGVIIVGELDRPIAGQGGGAGGDAVQSATFPSVPFSPAGDEKGAGGAGGGGLGLFVARSIAIGPSGRIVADGGAGAGGENTFFFNRVGGGSGGASGGYLVLEADLIDLGFAQPGSLSARGGRGGEGQGNVFGEVCAGGNGGPGLIQLHVESPSDIVLPPGTGLGALSAPDALVLLPELTD